MKFTTLILVFTLISLNTYGQVIQGSILTKGGQDFVPFATILVEGTQIGTVSNQEGKFELSTEKLAKEFTLIVSVIGFKTRRIKINKITLVNLTIELEENVIELDEVVFKYLSAEEIFNNFHKNYTSNYYQGSSLTKAFYHSTLVENGEYKHLLEATIAIREFSKKKHRNFEVEITQRRKSNDYRLERWGEKNNYLYDAIANNPMLKLGDFLALKNQKEYTVERLANTSYNDEIVYVLQFTPKKTSKKALFTAKIYFNSNDFGLIKAEYDFQNDKSKIRNQSLKDKTYHIPFISGSIHYQKIGKYYTQKYLSYTNGWTVINHVSKDTLAKDVLRDEILFLETELGNTKPLTNPLSKWGDIYKKPFAYDSEYWNKQVKIPPTQLIKKAIKDLEKHQSMEVQYFTNSANAILNQEFANSLGGKIDSVLTVYHLTNLFNGVALLTNQNQIVHHKAYGYADLENNIVLDTSTIFDIGSITKQFTTAMILKLREQGKLKLTDKIGKYLPEYRYADKINIHQLLAHRTGIPTFDYQDTLENSKWFTTKMEADELITTFCSGDLEFEPNSKMEYSNSNFLILTAIIEKVEQKSYYSLVKELIFEPLKLNDSYRPDSLPNQNVAKGYILDGTKYIPEPNWKKENMKGGGCIYSTSSDLLRWIQATNSTELLNQEDKKLIKSPISHYDYYDSDFGYSWGINTTLFKTAEPTYFYGGTSLGFFSMITTLPKSGITIILLSNKGNFPRIELTNEMLKILDDN
jgi:CubicO group peptidase (beta-lactamase class C family)